MNWWRFLIGYWFFFIMENNYCKNFGWKTQRTPQKRWLLPDKWTETWLRINGQSMNKKPTKKRYKTHLRIIISIPASNLILIHFLDLFNCLLIDYTHKVLSCVCYTVTKAKKLRSVFFDRFFSTGVKLNHSVWENIRAKFQSYLNQKILKHFN